MILIVEDDLGLSELIADTLSDNGYETHVEGNGAQALGWLKNSVPTLLLLDYSLPDMTAGEFVSAMERQGMVLPPFIVSTGRGDERIAVEMMKRGGRDYIVKNLNFLEALPGIVRRVLMEIERERKLEEANAEIQKWADLFKYAEWGVASVKEDGCSFELMNQTFATMHGYALDELRQKTLQTLIFSDGPERGYQMLEDGKRTCSNSFEACHVRKDGTVFPVMVGVCANKETSGFAIHVQDISRIKETELALIKAKEAAEAANVTKSQFLANMSHEIRTPLNGIMGTIQLLELTELTEEQQEYIRISKTSSEVLLAVINDILDYSKIEAGMMKIENHPFFIEAILKDVVDLFKVTVRKKGLGLAVEIDKKVPLTLVGDAFRLRQVFSNLIGNAVKFTERGTITVGVQTVSMPKDNQVRLLFSVKDTGIGVPADKTSALFKSFSQVEDSHSKTYGGAGLGLSICKGLVRQMGGEIWVETQYDKGSTFFFTAVFGMEISNEMQLP